MSLIVVKFGGTSVADVDKIERAAEKVVREVRAGHQVVVVVSAMSGVTNQLVGYCNEVSTMHDLYEYDVVVSSGEQVTAGLMALALHKHGIAARSWLGWQIPFKTDEMHSKARVRDIETKHLLEALEKGEVAVVPGFQGVTFNNRISTLGRGGSDTSAVALAAALKAERCDIYTDVDGVYTTDPRIVPGARKLKTISFEEMMELASLGAKVLQTRSVEIAMKHGVALQVLSSFEDAIGSDMPGTLVVREDKIMEEELVSGIACGRDEAKITLLRVADKPGVASAVFTPLGEAGINVDMIVQNITSDGQSTDMTFTVSRADLERALKVLKDAKIECDEIRSAANVAKISVVGVGMKSHAGVAQKMFTALASKGINIQVISTSEIKISVLIEEDYAELAVRTLHSAYGLEEAA
ncbi:MAG: aspartate kinase [Alphaproteobacteria bacterium]|nr:aspartate kinase [Alphaproteobacteria bacterium]